MKLIHTRLFGFVAGCILAIIALLFVIDVSFRDDTQEASSVGAAATEGSSANDISDLSIDKNTSDQKPALLPVEPIESPTELKKNEVVETTLPAVLSESHTELSTQSSTTDSTPALEPPSDILETASTVNSNSKPLNIENFWGPFANESRAIKFARYIEQIINKPIEISNDENGYLIGFRYNTEDELVRTKQEIQNKTGINLNMPPGR